MAALTPSYSELPNLLSHTGETCSFYNEQKYGMQKQNYNFYDIKKFMCLGNSISDNATFKNTEGLLKQGNKKCQQALQESCKINGYKYCTTNNDDTIHFIKLFNDHYTNLFYCMHLYNDSSKCNSLFKNFYETINYDELNKKEPSKIDDLCSFTKKVIKKVF